jgi:hypothetical protein
VAPPLLGETGMTDQRTPERDRGKGDEPLEGRETPVLGPRRSRKKVRPLDAEPATDRPYDSGAAPARPDDPWQDPGGAEPANG